MRDSGNGIDDGLLQYLSPLGWEHINLIGDYVWRQSRRAEDVQFRPLRINGKASASVRTPSARGGRILPGCPTR
ncbi:Tn3 family transposase [Pseudomonas aeruginosa]|nr:Tn3 family transposase [Alicycliphilus denitrificans]EKW0509517.1 Tn3 family transposase [Pseudomonas aeruginosa]EKY1307085.1 Tn3 family transposase [Pseudomonas aeruginosa]